MPHTPPPHVAEPFVTGAQSAAVQQALCARHAPPQTLKPELQVKPHWPPLQVGTELGGDGQSDAIWQHMVPAVQNCPHTV